MSASPTLGARGAHPLNLERLIETRLLIQASSGAGKSWCLRRILEQTHGKVQQIVIDPEGEFASLREKFDYVLVARNGGDAIADPKLARILAVRLLELGVSAILDIYELPPRDRVAFVKQFVDALVNAPRKLRHQLLVVLDEAHVFCPQKGDAESAQAVIDLCSRGRKRGFCPILATQRLSKLNKDAAAEMVNKLIGRTGLDVDAARAIEELGMVRAEGRAALRTLEAGEFFAYGPALTMAVERIRIGPVQTTHPKSGSRIDPKPPPPSAAIRDLLPKLGDLPKEAAEEMGMVLRIQAENAELRRELHAAKRPGATKADLAVATQAAQNGAAQTRAARAMAKAVQAAGVALCHALGPELGRMGRAASNLVEWSRKAQAEREAALARFRAQMDEALGAGVGEAGIKPGDGSPATPRPGGSAARITAPRANVSRVSLTVPANGRDDLTGPECRILDGIAWLGSLGIESPRRAAVAFVAHYSPSGGAFLNPLGKLRSAGLIEYGDGASVRLTDLGRGLAWFPDEVASADQLQRRVLEVLDGPRSRILKPLLAAYPEALTRPDLAAACEPPYSPNGGAFLNPLGGLRTLGLVVYQQGGLVVADHLLFPGA